MTEADLVFTGGSIFTAGLTTSRPGGAAITNGVITHIGSDEEVAALIGAETEVVDLAGGLLLPGFQDAHAHPISGGVELLQCNLTEALDAADCLRLISAYAVANPQVDWILGGGWSMDFFPGGTPTRAELDAIVPDRPVLLSNRDHHGVWVNTAALTIAGVDASTPDPVDGRIERESDGYPAGTIHEGAVALFETVRPAIDPQMSYDGMLRSQQEFLALGITSWQDAAVGNTLGLSDSIGVYLRGIAEGTLAVRVSAALWLERTDGLGQIEGMRATRERVAARAGEERLAARTVKIMVDGVAENFTAAMSSPYLDNCGAASANTGLSFIAPQLLNEYVVALDAAGFNVHFHALGDRAVAEALDSLEAARAANGITGNRHHLAHLQVIAERDIERFTALGASANLQALWAHPDKQLIDLTFPFLSPELVDRTYPFGDLQRAGVHLVAGSDWPVSTADPLLAIHVSVNRTIPEGDDAPLGGDAQKIDLAAAVTAYTAGSAFVNNRDDTGELRVGYLADLVVLDRDPFTLPVDRIADAVVVGTWIDGVRLYTAPALESASK